MTKNWLDETKVFFFKGACYGWAGGNSGTVLREKDGSPGMERWREVIYRETLGFAGFHFADRWGNDPDSGKPSGSIIITHWNLPVWGMWVGGEVYDESVFAFLRQALMANYQQRQFLGGRGPCEFRLGDLIYTNVCEGGFSCFRGHEKVEREDKKGGRSFLGSHSYWGGSFVFLPSS